MMESTDDDITILPNQDTLDGNVWDNNACLRPQDFVISRSVVGARPDPAVQALQQAYSDLKKKYNETAQKNQQITRALRDVRRVRGSDNEMATYGETPDTYSAGAQGAASTGEHVSDDVRVQQGYIKYLEREKLSNEAKLQQMASMKASVDAMQNRLRDTVVSLQRKEEDLKRAHETIKELKEENMQLRDDRDRFHKHASDLQVQVQGSVLQTSLEKQMEEFGELKVKYQGLQGELDALKKECDRLRVSENMAQNELLTSNANLKDCRSKCEALFHECSALKEGLRTSDLPVGSSMPTLSNHSTNQPSMPTIQEMDYLKKVIADLRKTVIQQRDFLSKLGKPGLITGVKSESVLARQVADAGLGPSWENVASHTPLSPRDNDHIMDARELSPRKIHASEGSVNIAALRQVRLEHSKSEVLRRRSSPVPSSPHSRSEVIMKAPEMRRNIGECVPMRESQSQIVNTNHMNGGTARFQSAYDNMSANSDSRRTTERVVCDSFDPVHDNTPAFPLDIREVTGTSQKQTPNYMTSDPTPPEAPNNGETTEEKICPVCSRAFTSMPIEDFQTHVFECFDDHSAPETLRPSNQNERICPMCNKLYPESVSQDEFEKHVQTHFDENIVDRFEIIEP